MKVVRGANEGRSEVVVVLGCFTVKVVGGRVLPRRWFWCLRGSRRRRRVWDGGCDNNV